MTINDIKPLTSNATYSELKQNFDILYLFTDYDETFLSKIPENYFTDPASCHYHGSHKHGLLLHSINVALLTYNNLLEMRKSKSSSYLDNLNEDDFFQYLKDSVFAGLIHDFVKIGKYKNEEDATEKQLEYALGLCKELNFEPDIFDILTLGKKSIGSFIEKAKNLLYDTKNDKIDNEDDFVKRAKELAEIKREYEYDKDAIDIGHGEASVVLALQCGAVLTDHQLITIRYHMVELDSLYQVEVERKKMLNYLNIVPMLKALYVAEKITGFLLESSGN